MTDFVEVYNTIDKNISTNGNGGITGETLHDTFYDVVHSFETYYNESKRLVDLAKKDHLLCFNGIYDELPIPEYIGQVVFVKNDVYVCTELTEDITGWKQISDMLTYTPILITIPKNVINNTVIDPKDLGIYEQDINNILLGQVGYINIVDDKLGFAGSCSININKTVDYIRISYFTDVVHSYILRKENNEWKIFVE